MTEYMNLKRLMKNYRPGSYDPPWGWRDEASDLLPRLESALIKDIAKNGILTPVLLGDDGRVWDGHHRIVIALSLGLSSVPVEFATGGPCD